MSTIQESIADVAKNIKLSSDKEEITKKEVIDNISNNISQFKILQKQIMRLYTSNFENLEKYSAKLKKAKQEFSKQFLQKKVTKYQNIAIELLTKLNSLDNTVKNLTGTKERLLKPEEPVEKVEDPAIVTPPDEVIVEEVLET